MSWFRLPRTSDLLSPSDPSSPSPPIRLPSSQPVVQAQRPKTQTSLPTVASLPSPTPRNRKNLGHGRAPRPASLPDTRGQPLLERRVVSAPREGRNSGIERIVSVERKASDQVMAHARKVSSEGMAKLTCKLRTLSDKWKHEVPAVPRVVVPPLLLLPQSVLGKIVLEAGSDHRIALVCRVLNDAVKVVRQSHRSSAISADDEILSYYLGHLPRPSLFHLPPHLPAHLSNDAVERLASEAAHVPVEEQLDDLLYVCRPNDHAKRLEECSEIHTRCATLLGLYHSLDPRDTTEKHTLEIRNAVASLAFSHSFTALAPSLMSREMIPALRSLCHLRVVCRTGSRVPVAGEHEWESLSAVPPIDLDGTVAWEEIEQVQGLLYSVVKTNRPSLWLIARPALHEIARPRQALPRVSRNWAQVGGEWVVVVASARDVRVFGGLQIREVERIPDDRLTTLLPRSTALPDEHFEGSGGGVAVQGVVCLTTDCPAELRYSMKIQHGDEELRFEGIQVGGLGSKHGVMGIAYRLGVDRPVACPCWLFKVAE